MKATARALILQRWGVIQGELLPELRQELGALTPKLEAVIRTLEWVRIEQYVAPSWCGIGRQPHERAWLANAFVAKSVLRIWRALPDRRSADAASDLTSAKRLAHSKTPTPRPLKPRAFNDAGRGALKTE